jgi:uncharacterized protein YlxW (UPF0749 family)
MEADQPDWEHYGQYLKEEEMKHAKRIEDLEKYIKALQKQIAIESQLNALMKDEIARLNKIIEETHVNQG